MLSVAVIGAGNMGKSHARNYSQFRNARLVAVSDIDTNRSKQVADAYGCKHYADHKEMLKEEELDAVSVATPNATHADIAVDCMKKGLHVLVEKPIADTIENAQRIIDAANKHEVRLCVGHIERFNPGVRALKNIINQGKLGKILSITSKRVGPYPPHLLENNVIIDLAVHDIDVCNYLLEESPESVYCKGGRALQERQVDYAEIFLRYPSTNSIIQANWVTPVKVRVLSITGTKGYAELNYITQKLTLFESNYTKKADSYGESLRFLRPTEKNLLFETQEPLQVELKAFLDHINGAGSDIVSGLEGLRVLETALKASESI